MMFSVVIVCAGKSSRLGKDKVLLPLGGKPIFMHSVLKFSECCDDVIVVANESNINEIQKYHSNVVLGGATRQDSVACGVRVAKYNSVLIHDGARPFVSIEDILKIMETKAVSAFLGRKVINSLKQVGNFKNVNRDEFVMATTPQLVAKDIYLRAYEKATVSYSDDVTLLQEEMGIEPIFVTETVDNYKITTEEDYKKAMKEYDSFRIGYSWDVHKLVVGRKLILGGIEIPHKKGLLGHSDADALLHAIAEALLGSLALGDLGTHYPDNDPKYKDIDSKILLSDVYKKVQKLGYEIVNLDTMIFAEEPKLKPYILSIRNSIKDVLGISLEKVSVKATTYEKMDAIGRGEAIAASATILVRKI